MLGEASRLRVPGIRMETNSLWNPVGVYKVTNVTLQLSWESHLNGEICAAFVFGCEGRNKETDIQIAFGVWSLVL